MLAASCAESPSAECRPPLRSLPPAGSPFVKSHTFASPQGFAHEYGVAVGDGEDEITEDELMTKAEAFAIRRNGRSPRTARQFIELLKIGI